MSVQGPVTGRPAASMAVLIAAAVLTVLATLAWLPMVAGLTSLTGSDAAGNALSQAYTAIAIVFVWILLAVLALIAWIKGDMPRPLALAALLLIPAACVASFIALALLVEPGLPPYRWPIVVPAVAPPLIVLFCFWALVPLLRRAVPSAVAGTVTLGGVLVLCAALYPMGKVRDAVHEKEAAIRQRYEAEFAALKPDAPLADWVRLLETPDEVLRDKVIAAIRALPRRQSEAESMLDRGEFPVAYLGRFDIELTPAVCTRARAQLGKQAAALLPEQPGTRNYAQIAGPVSDALAALKWLIGYGCNADAEVAAWERTANSYTATNFDVVELRGLHDPKLLGKILREQPERFSMLSQQSHLAGWLKFIDDDDRRDKVLAGARALPRRTADAVEILEDKYGAIPPWLVIQYLPVLDLEATPRLCAAALRLLEEDFRTVYRPGPDNPLPYSELLERLGVDAPLTGLLWLGRHGCDVEKALDQAEAAVRSYQDTRGRAEMLAQLAALRKKP